MLLLSTSLIRKSITTSKTYNLMCSPLVVKAQLQLSDNTEKNEELAKLLKVVLAISDNIATVRLSEKVPNLLT
jgi:hypothetical protein